MKTLILSCNTGGGHNTAGRALLEELNRRDLPAEMLDALSFGRKHTSRIVSQSYINVASVTPKLFGGIYHLGDFISSSHRKSPVYLANAHYAETLHRYIVENGFDTVLCPHLFPAEALTWARKKLGGTYKFYMVATDYTCIPFTEETEPDAFFIPHADLIPEYEEKGVPRDKLLVTGIPISRRFPEHMEKAAARQALNLSRSAHICLMMTGSMGFGDILPLPEKLCAAEADVQVIVLTGSNAEMRKRLAERYGSSGRVIALPFTDRVADYMAACDVMLSKPGGLTSTEAAALNVPLIHTDPIPGCETRNAAFFQEHGMSLRAVGTEEIAQTAASLLYNAPLQQAMIQAQAKTINAYAARDAIDLALERCTSPGV